MKMLLSGAGATRPPGPGRPRCPRTAGRFWGGDQLLSMVRPPSRGEPVLYPRGRPRLYRSLGATVGDWSAHRASATAPAAVDSGLRWLTDVGRGSGLDPICAAPCRP